MHGAVWLEHGPQGAQPRVGIGQVVQHARTHDLVETAAQLTGPLDRQLADLQIVQMVFAFQRLGVANARLADVDADHLASGLAQGVLGRLRCPTAGDQHGQVRAIGFIRPMQVEVCAAPAFILPTLAIAVEVFNRRRIRVQVIEGTHGVLDSAAFQRVSFQFVHATARENRRCNTPW